MFRFTYTGLILLLGVCSLSGQKFKPHIENLRTDLVDNCLEIRYDIEGSSLGQFHMVDLIVIDNMGNIILPDSVTGDVGPEVRAGKNRVITWDIHKEYDVVYGDFHPQIVLDGSEKYGKNGGPGNLFLSLLVPGLGDYFVEDYKNMKIKPYYKTAFTYGMLGLSLAAALSREQIPPVMGAPGWYWAGNHLEGPLQHVYRDDWWLMEAEKTDYWLFPYDSEVFLGIGIAAWLTDIIWVARRGVQNNKIRKQFLDHISLVPAHQGVVFRLAYNF